MWFFHQKGIKCVAGASPRKSGHIGFHPAGENAGCVWRWGTIHQEYSVQTSTYFINIKFEGCGRSQFLTISLPTLHRTTRRTDSWLDFVLVCIIQISSISHLKEKEPLFTLINRIRSTSSKIEYVDMEFGNIQVDLESTSLRGDHQMLLNLESSTNSKSNRHPKTMDENEHNEKDSKSHWLAKDRFIDAKDIAKRLKEVGAVRKKSKTINPMLETSERTRRGHRTKNLPMQWFTQNARTSPNQHWTAVRTMLIQTILSPEVQKNNVFGHWMGNVRDWCISANSGKRTSDSCLHLCQMVRFMSGLNS